MFVVNTDIEVNWMLPATVFSYQNTNFDVAVKKPDGTSIYFDGSLEPGGAIKTEDFIAPTEITTGAASYRFSPDETGVWIVILTMGDTDYNSIFYEYFLRVSKPDTHIYQQVTV
jgi:hypothetical protein